MMALVLRRSINSRPDPRSLLDYLHFNPVKHGHVQRVADWPYSTFHRLVAQDVYAADWSGSAAADGLVGLD